LDRRSIAELRAEGYKNADVDRLSRLRAIVANDGRIVTVMHWFHRVRRSERAAA
jgi:hypothetical protein